LRNIIRIFTFRFNRVVEEEVTVGGYTIPKGVDIQFPICVIHRDIGKINKFTDKRSGNQEYIIQRHKQY
jgi:hypothetical protein